MNSPKILVVDDDLSILKLLEKRLQTEGFQVVTASTGQEAVSKAQLLDLDLIIMDIMLPDIDGPEAYRSLRNNAETGSIPVIFLSGIVNQPSNELPTLFIDKNPYPAIGKPIDFDFLLKAVRNVLSG